MKPFERSELTDRIARYLQSMEKRTQLTYAEISKAVEHQLDSRSHKLLYAIRLLEREHNQVWICVPPRIGIRRLDDPEIAARLSRWWMNGARRKLTRGGDQADVVELDRLNIDEQARFSVNAIQRELALQSLSKAAAKKLSKVARGTSNDLPRFNIIEWALSLNASKQ